MLCQINENKNEEITSEHPVRVYSILLLQKKKKETSIILYIKK